MSQAAALSETLQNELFVFLSVLGEDSSPLARAAAAGYFRRYYSADHVDEDLITNRIVIQRLLKIMESEIMRSSMTAGRLDAAWALTNVVCQSSEMCHQLVLNKGVEVLVRIAQTEPFGSELKMQIYWAIGNIAADCSQCKNACRRTPMMLLLGHSLHDHEFKKRDQTKNVIWCTLNIVRGGIENIPLEAVGMILLSSERIINANKHNKDCVDYVKDTVWVVASLADDMNTGQHINVLAGMETLLVDLIEILLIGNSVLHHGCLRVLGNIATGNTEQTAAITNHPAFYEVLVKFLSGGGPLAIEAAWLCSNVAAGPDEHVALLFKDNRLYEKLLEGLAKGDVRMKKECAWSIVNALAGASEDRHQWLIAVGVVSTFALILDLDDIRIVARALGTLAGILIDYPYYTGLIHDEQVLQKVKPWMLDASPEVPGHLEEIRRTMKRHLEMSVEGEAVVVIDP